ITVFNETVYDFAIRNLLLNSPDKRSIGFSDLNRISSHRFSYFETFATLFPGNELIGIGSYYMDNFYMEVILNYGIFIGLIIIALALFPLKVAFSFKNSNIESILAIRIIALSYAFNGIFEGLAPFGPGAKCFFLWLIVGVLLNRSGRSSAHSDGYILTHTNVSQ
ncbi:MAG: polymerase, partial [Clostridiales bacterium]|nr:polymerase [Clostridiales bacterium]